MTKIFWFQKKNNDGTLKEEYFDCNERQAWNYIRQPLKFKYIGQSDGSAIKKALKEITQPQKDDRTFMLKDVSESTKEILRTAQKDELEMARSNTTKPVDQSIKDPWGKLDQNELNRIKNINDQASKR